MPLYRYKVKDRDGKVLTGTLEGTDANTIVERLDTYGYVPMTITEVKRAAVSMPGVGGILGGRVKSVDLVNFTRQFVALHKAGLPMLSAIGALQSQTRSKALSNALDAIRKDLMGGASLSVAMSKFPRIFNELFVNSIWAGETGGVLDEIMARLADLLEHERKLRSDVQSAMRYPAILGVGFVVAAIVLATYVMPKFIGILTSTGSKLPMTTKILVTGVGFAQKYWFLGLMIIGVAGAMFFLFTRTGDGKIWWDRSKLKIPIFGQLLYKMTMSRFSRMFETLDRTGLPILRCLGLVAKTTGNAYISQHIDKVAESVRRGRGIAAPMRESNVFPPMVVQMVATGEESGALDDMLKQISDYYDGEVEYAVKNLTGMIEPVLILVMGVGIIFLIIAVIQPYMSILSGFGSGGGAGPGM